MQYIALNVSSPRFITRIAPTLGKGHALHNLFGPLHCHLSHIQKFCMDCVDHWPIGGLLYIIFGILFEYCTTKAIARHL